MPDGQLHEKVNDLRVTVGQLTVEQKNTNKSIEGLCGKLDRYSDRTERRLAKVEEDLGDRPPDDPNAFAQLQSLQGFRLRSGWWVTTAIGLLVTVIGGLLTAWVSGAFGN